MTQTARGIRYSIFAILALLVNGLAFQVRAGGDAHDVIRSALFFDCAITVPVAYWLLLVRPGLRGRTSLALIAAVSVMRGAYMLNSHAGMAVGILAEAALVIFIATRVKRLEDILPSRTIARIARAEIDVYRYAFGRSKPVELPEGAQAFTIHESSGAATLFWMLAFLTPFEAVGLHFILPAKLAWISTALSVYGAIWMIAVARSLSALPVIVGERGITLRRGLLASMYVPRDAIASVSNVAPVDGYARFAVLADPTVHIEFNRPFTVELPMGFTRQVNGASVAPDDSTGFSSAISRWFNAPTLP